MKNIQLNGPKKIHSDKDVTIFRDKNGHEIRVAHAALSPKMLKELHALPVHGKEPKKMAGGGDPVDDDSDVDDQTQPDPSVAQESQPQAQSNSPLDVEPIQPGEDNGTETQAAQDQEDQVDSSQAIPAPAASNQPAQAPQSPTAAMVSNPLDANTLATQFNQDYAQLKQDVGTGAIKPMTMADIWSKTADGQPRGTLSKIGLLFSMLAGGMGSGLTHQPNLIMQSMQKEIDNDLAAQQNTKTNQFNAFTAATQHVQALSGLNLQQMQAKYQQALTANQPIEAKKLQSEIAVNKANQQLIATNKSKQALVLSVLQHTLGQTNNMPPGPMKQNAMAAHQMLSQASDAHIAQQNQQTAQQIENNWKQNNMALSMVEPGLAQWQAERHLPGQTQYASTPIAPQDRSKMSSMDALDSQIDALQGFIKQHPAGELSPAALQKGQQMAAEIIPLYSSSLGGDLSQGRTEWLNKQINENPAGLFQQIAGSPARIQEIKDANDRRRQALMGQYYVPGGYSKGEPAQGSSANQGASNEIERLDPKSGRVAVYDSKTKKPLRWK